MTTCRLTVNRISAEDNQFNTKEAIVLACTEEQVPFLGQLLDDAAASGDHKWEQNEVLTAIVDMAVARLVSDLDVDILRGELRRPIERLLSPNVGTKGPSGISR